MVRELIVGVFFVGVGFFLVVLVVSVAVYSLEIFFGKDESSAFLASDIRASIVFGSLLRRRLLL